MEEDQLRPSHKALEEWEKLPKNTPSKQALPPATGGLVLGYRVLGGFVIIVVIMTLLYLLSS